MKRAAEPALSDLSVTEFVTLSRLGFLPRGLVIGCAVYDAGGIVADVSALASAMHVARGLAVKRMRTQARDVGAEGVVGVRLEIEHHRWRGGHLLARFLAIGTAIRFEPDHAPDALRGSPSLRLADGGPFTSDLSGVDFVALARAGYRPVALALGNSAVQVNLWVGRLSMLTLGNVEVAQYTQAFFDARETAMNNLQRDLFREFPPTHADHPDGVVGMVVSEETDTAGPGVVEFSAVGTAVARLRPDDPRRAPAISPRIVVPLDR